jgi:hypothetical protein
MVYYHRQTGQVVVGRWETIDKLTGPFWDADGLHATLLVGVQGYRLVVLPEGQATLEGAALDSTSERWEITMVYDPQDERWKIEQATTLFDF